MKKVWISALLLFAVISMQAQEFNATVRVTAPTLQLADPKIINLLQQRVDEFMNTNKWTDDTYEPEERINLNLQITITKDLSANQFRVDLGVQATRPVYGSGYESPIFAHLDKDVAIAFEEFKPIVATKNQFVDNLSSILSFYAYLVIGLDRDSFSPFGGSDYLLFCQEIVNAVPPSVARGLDQGWANPRDNQTRFFIIDDILNPKMKGFRQGFYDYHRKGLDLMHNDAAAGKSKMKEYLVTLDELNQSYPNTFIMRIFANTKASEITTVFQVGEQRERFEIYNIMSRIDPANSSKYEPIRRG